MEFVTALKQNNFIECKSIPKSDLHNHIDLGGNFEYVSQRLGKRVLLVQPKEYYSGVSGMDEQFLKGFLPCFPKDRDMVFLWEAALQEAYDNGVYVLSPDIGKCAKKKFKGSLETGIATFYEIAKKVYGGDYHKLKIYPNLTLKRGSDPKEMDCLLDEAIECCLISGIDLIGPEEYPPELYFDLFEKAHKNNLKCKAHIGEYADPAHVMRYIETLRLDSIMHGITIVNSKEAINLVKEKGITLHVCPTSNIVLGYASSYSDHPIRQLVRSGVKVTINTDDRLVFGSSVTNEYLHLYNSGCLTPEELESIRKFGLCCNA